jgi:hypothetical protein
MLRIRKYINERGRASAVGIALIVVLAVVLSMAVPALGGGSVGQTSLGWKNQEQKQQWDDGNYGAFPEGDYWQCQITMDNNTDDPIDITEFGIALRFWESISDSPWKGAVGVDWTRNWAWSITPSDFFVKGQSTPRYPYTGDPLSPNWTGNWHPFTPDIWNMPYDEATDWYTTTENCSSPVLYHFYSHFCDNECGSGIPNTLPAHTSLAIYTEPHLALTYLWSRGLEGALPIDGMYDGTPFVRDWSCQWFGAGHLSGSSMHGYIVWGGAKTFQLPSGVVVSGSISGHKYNDKDGSGNLTAGDVGIANWPIVLTGTVEGSPVSVNTTTDSNGYYEFPDLPEGTGPYCIEEAPENGYAVPSGYGGYTHTSDSELCGIYASSSGNDFFNMGCCMEVIKGSIDACYPDVDSAEEDAIAATTATDTCSGVDPTLEASTVGTCSAVITVTATDVCGNTANVTYNTRIDATAPELSGVPGDENLGCNPTLPVCDTGVTANDNCDGNITADVVCTPGSVIDVGACNKSQTFTYYVEDECGNNDTDEVTYTWKVDTTKPVLGNLPGGGNLGCNPTLPVCDTGVTANDNCDGNITADVVCTPGSVIDVGACNKSQTFTYYVEDECGNNDTDEVTYTWKVDTTKPVLDNLPGGGDLGCSEPPSCVAGLNATDNCDGQVPVQCAAGNITGTTCNWTQTFTYWAADLCGNNASANVTYTWKEPQCCVTCGTAVAANGTAGQALFGGKQDNWFTYITYNKGEGNSTTPKEYPIFANQDQRVGTLYVYNNSTRLFVQYCADFGLGVHITSYHLEVVDEFNGFNDIRTKWRGIYGNPIPGRSEYSGSYADTSACSDWIVSVNDDISTYGDNDIYIFAHSIMCWSQD